jgi:hypothetical protein
MTLKLTLGHAEASLSSDLDSLRAIGHSAIALINTAILLAIVAVILSKRSQSAAVLASAFAFGGWLIGQIITPITGGASVVLGNQLAPAGGYPIVATGGNTTGATSTGTLAGGSWDTGTQTPGTGGTGTPVSSSTLTCFRADGSQVVGNADGTCPP